MSINKVLYMDTYRWIASLSKLNISTMILNIKFDNLKTTDAKINSLTNWFKPNNSITLNDVKNIRIWIKKQIIFKKTQKNIISLNNIFSKDKCCSLLYCSKDYFDKWLNVKTFNSIDYYYQYDNKKINIINSTKKLCNTIENIFDDKAINLFKEIIIN